MDPRGPVRAWWGRAPSLRWQLIAAQMAVVLVGVGILLGTLEWVLRASDAAAWGATNGLAPGQAEALLPLVRRLAFRALLVAALAATLTGFATSLLLTDAILGPLRAIVRSSRRIARGHYGERVAVPRSVELATVATSFNQMASALDQIEQQRVTLIGDIMHELRTPLTALSGYLEGLLDGVIPAEAATYEQMDREVRRLQRLVSDLQELSRIEAGQVRLERQRLALTELVAQGIQRLAPQASAKGLTLIPPAPPSAPLLVWADPDRTMQVLINLLGNAIRYTPEGGTITVRLARRGPLATVAVADTGIGIAPEALPLLFERFYRADQSRDRRTGGSGIGLTIARHLAWAMGGDVSAESAGLGQGSTFHFTLPLAPPEP